MKKSIKILGLGIMTVTVLLSCQKKEEQPISPTGTEISKNTDSTTVLPNNPAVGSTEDLTKMVQSGPLTSIALSEADFDFGNIKKGDKVEHIFEITNTGKNPLIISTVKPACGCTAPEYTKDPIAPGKKGKITLSFDSTNFTGMVTKTAEVFANTEKAPIVLSFKANIQ
ncbi:MAG: DUF1573 domain-containing protein [Cloacibacterium sp.]|nr:DUF1573 domain-containing protein [Cloacibacterium sp.]